MVIGAGLVATSNIPDDSVTIGIPAKVIGSYFEFVKKAVSGTKACI